jgi:ribosome-associated protein
LKKKSLISSKKKVLTIAEAALNKKALDLVILNVSDLCSYTDYFVITSGTSDRHVQAVGEGIVSQMKSKGSKPLGIEGMQKGHWVLLDFDDVIVHVFYRPIREFYGLEKLWADAKVLEVPSDHKKRTRTKKAAK